MLSFKGYVHRWLAQVTQVAPFTRDAVQPMLVDAAVATMQNCYTNGACTFSWIRGSADNSTGAGQQMNALAVLSGVLMGSAAAPGQGGAGGGGANGGGNGQQGGQNGNGGTPPNAGNRPAASLGLAVAALGMALL